MLHHCVFRPSDHRRVRGFTLIELVITIVVIGILAAISYPNYTEYVRRTHRSAAQRFLMDIANRQEQILIDRRAYVAGADNATIQTQIGLAAPTELNGRYTFSVAVTAGPPPTFTATATAVGSQASDGSLTLTNTGAKTGKW